MNLTKWISVSILACGLFFFSACGGPKNLFVLMPDAEDGTVGSITVTNEAGKQIITSPDTVVKVKDAQTSPTPPEPMAEEGINKIFKKALAATPRPPAQFMLQFQTGTSSLTEKSQDQLSQIIIAVIDRQPCDVSIIGHTDTRGTAQKNVELGLQRANTVKQILIDQGVDARQIEATSHGETSLIIQTADDVDEPQNRRVEVLVR